MTPLDLPPDYWLDSQFMGPDDQAMRFAAIQSMVFQARDRICQLLRKPPIPLMVFPPGPSRTPAAASPSHYPPIMIWPDNPLWEGNLNLDDLPQFSHGIFSHEVGHLTRTNRAITDLREKELHADWFAGLLSCKAGLNRDVLYCFFQQLREGPVHPPGPQRAEAFHAGWRAYETGNRP